MHGKWLKTLTVLGFFTLVGWLGHAGDIQTDGKLVSVASTGAPLQVDSQTRVVNLNADFLDDLDSSQFAAVAHTHEVAGVKSWGPTTFALAKRDGTALVCDLPSGSCSLPVGAFTRLYISMGIEGPATITEITCRVLDDDTGGDITLTLFSSSVSVDSSSTSGAFSSAQDLQLLTSQGVGAGSRGPVFQLEFDSNSAQPQMRVFSCHAGFDRTIG